VAGSGFPKWIYCRFTVDLCAGWSPYARKDAIGESSPRWSLVTGGRRWESNGRDGREDHECCQGGTELPHDGLRCKEKMPAKLAAPDEKAEVACLGKAIYHRCLISGRRRSTRRSPMARRLHRNAQERRHAPRALTTVVHWLQRNAYTTFARP